MKFCRKVILQLFLFSTILFLEIVLKDFCNQFMFNNYQVVNNTRYLNVTRDFSVPKDVGYSYSFSSANLVTGCLEVKRLKIDGTENPNKLVSNSQAILEIAFKNTSDSSQFVYYVPVVNDSTITQTVDQAVDQVMNAVVFGTTTYGKTAYYSGASTVVVSITPVSVNLSSLTTSSSCIGNTSLASITSGPFYYDCFTDNTGSSQNYFRNQMVYNWGLWFFIICFFFVSIFGIFASYDSNDKSVYENNNKTLHPLYSIWNTGDEECFSKRSRITLLCLTLTAIGFFNGLMTNNYIEKNLKDDVDYGIRFAVFPFFAIIFSMFPTYFAGLLLNRVYACTNKYIDDLRNTDSHDKKVEIDNNFYKSNYQREFVYYMALILMFLFLSAYNVYVLARMSLRNQGFWLIQTTISVLFDFLVLDILAILLARVEFFKRIFRMRGYYFDKKMVDGYNRMKVIN